MCEPHLVLTVFEIVVKRQRKVGLNAFPVAVIRLNELRVVIELNFVRRGVAGDLVLLISDLFAASLPILCLFQKILV